MVNRRKNQGFSLIELMVVVVIIGIIAAIALPAYKKQVQKSNRSAAKSALLDLASREEKYYSIYYNYTATMTGLYPGSTATFPINVPSSGPTLYQINAPTVVGQTASNTGVVTTATFSLTATPFSSGPQAGDACGSFTITNTGAQSVSGTNSGCW